MSTASATFTVVVSHFNDSEYLEQALAGVFEQEEPPDQVIVVDDGSDPSERAAFDVALARYPQAEVVRHRENRGALAAGESGLALANGDYVAWWSVDDRVDPEIVVVARNAARRFPGVGVIAPEARVVVETPDGEKPLYEHTFGTDPAGTFVTGDQFASLNGHRYVWLSSSGAFVRRDVLLSELGWREEFGLFADWIALYSAALQWGAVLVGRQMSTIVRREDSAGAVFRADKHGRIHALRAILHALRNPPGSAVRDALRRGPLALSHAFGWLLLGAAWRRPRDWDVVFASALRHSRLRVVRRLGHGEPTVSVLLSRLKSCDPG